MTTKRYRATFRFAASLWRKLPAFDSEVARASSVRLQCGACLQLAASVWRKLTAFDSNVAHATSLRFHSFLQKLFPFIACALFPLLLPISLHAQTDISPQIGYLFPAGAKRGQTTQIVLGGQFLRKANAVHISGTGATANIVKDMRELRNINGDNQLLFLQAILETRDKRLTEMGDHAPPLVPWVQKQIANRIKQLAKQKPKGCDCEGECTCRSKMSIPDHPLLLNMENKSLEELAHIKYIFNYPEIRKRQPNRQLMELLLIDVTVASDAPLGDRELRVETHQGLSNPVVFQIGNLPEISELEPNHQGAKPAQLIALKRLPSEKPLEIPVLINGQIMPGDVDRFSFMAKKGQKLVIQVRARQLIPYLADAVPGWFQPVMTLYSKNGKEIETADDFRFEPDPVILFEVPRNDEYQLEIRDSIYRGRQDFVYRLSISESPFITHMFPLGGQCGAKNQVAVKGWNLPSEKLVFKSAQNAERQTVSCQKNGLVSNQRQFALGDMIEQAESEPNDSPSQAQRLELDRLINGKINYAGDADFFQFEGKKNQMVAVEVEARRLGSPLDSLIHLLDANGKIVAWNDDYVIKSNHLHKNPDGKLTHHADSYLFTKFPRNGVYRLRVSDASNHGDDSYAYRLRISRPKPDFQVVLTPSSVFLAPGATTKLTAYAIRKDGFEGPISLTLTNNPHGFKLNGGVIPKGKSEICFTLTAPPKVENKRLDSDIAFLAVAQTKGNQVSHPAHVADNVMQAFLYRHLLPAQELKIVFKQQKWSYPKIEMTTKKPIEIPIGGTSEVTFKMWDTKFLKNNKLALTNPPPGVSIEKVNYTKKNVSLTLKASKEASSCSSDNLIVEAFREIDPKKKQQPKQRQLVGMLPAIPIEIMKNIAKIPSTPGVK